MIFVTIFRRYISNDVLFDQLVEAATKQPHHRWVLGGNAPVMAKRMAAEGLDVVLGARVGQKMKDSLSDELNGC